MKKYQKNFWFLFWIGVLFGIFGISFGTLFEVMGRQWEGSAIYTLVGVVAFSSIGLFFVLIAPFSIYWLWTGLTGGWELTVKRARGRRWTLLVIFICFGLIPLILWLFFMVGMALLGEKAKRIAQNAKPSKQQCLQCRGWNDFEATRCRHCGQLLMDNKVDVTEIAQAIQTIHGDIADFVVDLR